MRFKDDTKKYKGVGQYPTYHTGYETFYLMDEIIDPGFKIHRTCAQVNFRITYIIVYVILSFEHVVLSWIL